MLFVTIIVKKFLNQLYIYNNNTNEIVRPPGMEVQPSTTVIVVEQ